MRTFYDIFDHAIQQMQMDSQDGTNTFEIQSLFLFQRPSLFSERLTVQNISCWQDLSTAVTSLTRGGALRNKINGLPRCVRSKASLQCHKGG